MRRFALFILALGALLGCAAGAQAQINTSSSTYTCDPTYYSYTGCAVITNDVETFTAPGKLGKVRPLVNILNNASPCMAFSTQANANVSTPIAAGKTGESQVGGGTCAAATFMYGMRLQDGPQNYQAVVGFRVDNETEDETCVISTYLDCTMGPQLETGRDSKRKFRVTSRPLEIKIVNTLPMAIRRSDGPYWSNALSNSAIVGAFEIAAGGTGYTGALRSVVRQSAYSAIYRVRRSHTDPTYNRASFAIDVRVAADGTKSGTCTPLYAPSRTKFTCTVDFTGSGTGNLIANIRVRP
ncbi:MAG: hypothetical protein ACR2J9_12210 [Gaiellales bacterium]